jgi:hypothetical protein
MPMHAIPFPVARLSVVSLFRGTEDGVESGADAPFSSSAVTLLSTRLIAPNGKAIFYLKGASRYRLQCFVPGALSTQVPFGTDQPGAPVQYFLTNTVIVFQANPSTAYQLTVINDRNGAPVTEALYCELRA